MNYKLLIILLLILPSCANVNSVKNYNVIDKSNKFSNYGFTLIYSDNLHAEKIVNKKINERDLIVFQKNLKKGVRLVKNKYETEASGNVNLKNLKKIASTGINRISIGRLTHSVTALDLKLEI